MFDAVRNNKRIVQVFLALITLPFAFFGVDSYMRDSGAGSDVAAIGDLKITQQQFQQTLREQQERQQRAFHQDQPAAIVAVAEREQEQDPQGISRLGERRNHAHSFDTQVKVCAHQRQQRLGIIDRCHAKASPECQH